MSESVQVRREDYWEDGPWPSKPNRADGDICTVEPSTDESLPEGRECIRPIIEKLREDYPALARMAISMSEGRKLRRECTREIRNGDGSMKSRLVQGVLKEFLRWFYDTEESKLHLESSEGRELLVDVPNTYNEDKAKEYYGRLKDLEREFVRESVDPHTTMLTFSASSTDDSGMLRPPGDHLRELQGSWSPSVRRELQRQMEDAGFERYDPDVEQGKWWEYVTIVEPHGESGGVASGYGHFHTAVFTSHEVSMEMFVSVIRKHVAKCDHAEQAAHNCFHPDPSKRPISINQVTGDDETGLGNLGSYLSEYIGGFSGPPSEREVYQLVFESVCWSTGTQRVRFSNGAGQLAKQGRARRAENGEIEIHDDDQDWTATAIENMESGETRPVAQKGGNDYMVEILNGPPVHRTSPGECGRSEDVSARGITRDRG